MKIGQFLQMITQEKGITQVYLASRLQVTQSQISSYYKRDLQISTFCRLCDACGLDPCEVLRQYRKETNPE